MAMDRETTRSSKLGSVDTSTPPIPPKNGELKITKQTTAPIEEGAQNFQQIAWDLNRGQPPMLH
jgi:hypothetical protein